jgi:hypothetical protein
VLCEFLETNLISACHIWNYLRPPITCLLGSQLRICWFEMQSCVGVEMLFIEIDKPR